MNEYTFYFIVEIISTSMKSDRYVKSIKLSDGWHHTNKNTAVHFYHDPKIHSLLTLVFMHFGNEFIRDADVMYWHNFEMRKVLISFKHTKVHLEHFSSEF